MSNSCRPSDPRRGAFRESHWVPLVACANGLGTSSDPRHAGHELHTATPCNSEFFTRVGQVHIPNLSRTCVERTPEIASLGSRAEAFAESCMSASPVGQVPTAHTHGGALLVLRGTPRATPTDTHPTVTSRHSTHSDCTAPQTHHQGLQGKAPAWFLNLQWPHLKSKNTLISTQNQHERG